MRRKRWYIGIGIIAITLLCIWNNSLQSTMRSNEQSDRLLEYIEAVIRVSPLDTEEAQHIVRKAAHVLEFTLLGLEMALLLYLAGKMFGQYLMAVLFTGLVSSVMDETIQIFSRRGSQVADIWIDFAGFAMGIGITVIAYSFYRMKNSSRKQKRLPIDNKHKYQYDNTRIS